VIVKGKRQKTKPSCSGRGPEITKVSELRVFDYVRYIIIIEWNVEGIGVDNYSQDDYEKDVKIFLTHVEI
jgi:hypothetical protein